MNTHTHTGRHTHRTECSTWTTKVVGKNCVLFSLHTAKAKFHYAIWFEAGPKLVADRFEPALNLSATSFEPDNVMEFGFNNFHLSVQYIVALSYLGPFVRAVDLPSRRVLRSASISRLVVPTFKRSSVSGRTFQVSGSRTWNELPEDGVTAPPLPIFRHRLKTYLFQKSYPD